MPPNEQQKPGTGQYYAKVSSADPMAGGPSPTSKFDFMMNDQPKQAGRFSGKLAWMPKPAKIALLAIAVLTVLVIVYSLFFGGKTTATSQVVSAMARAHEISRVSLIVQQAAKSADTKDLTATAETVLNSQEQELIIYLSKNKVKVDLKQLAAKLDKNTDTTLEKALQNNNYDQIYYSYLKQSLGTYAAEIQNAHQTAGPKLKEILSSDFDSINTLLAAPQLK